MLHEMVNKLLTPNVARWNTPISACEKGEQWEVALGLLLEMVNQLLTPDVVSWNAAISSCEKGAQW